MPTLPGSSGSNATFSRRNESYSRTGVTRSVVALLPRRTNGSVGSGTRSVPAEPTRAVVVDGVGHGIEPGRGGDRVRRELEGPHREAVLGVGEDMPAIRAIARSPKVTPAG